MMSNQKKAHQFMSFQSHLVTSYGANMIYKLKKTMDIIMSNRIKYVVRDHIISRMTDSQVYIQVSSVRKGIVERVCFYAG